MGSLLALIAGRDTEGFYEVRWPVPGGMGQRWFPLRDPEACQRFISGKASSVDTYIGAAPRRVREGGKSAIARAWCLWADLDTPKAVERLAGFRPCPTLTVGSGSANNRHAYWALSEPLAPVWVERANRRLAYHLGADPKTTDVSRILRPPGSLNHKHDPPVRVTCEACVPGPVANAALPLALIVGLLPDPPDQRPARDPRPDFKSDDPLLAISADRYYVALTGRDLARGNVTCPFHNGGNERSPSMRLYDTTWHCFGCGEGGSIFDFGAKLWDYETRGASFLELKEDLQREFGVT